MRKRIFQRIIDTGEPSAFGCRSSLSLGNQLIRGRPLKFRPRENLSADGGKGGDSTVAIAVRRGC